MVFTTDGSSQQYQFQIFASLFLVYALPWCVASLVLGGHGNTCLVANCNCSTLGLLDCSHRGFIDIPTFHPPRHGHVHFSILTLQFPSNNLTTIKDNAFQSLTGAHAVRIHLILTDNLISSIGDHAFHGIEDRISEILLTNNLLHSIPDSILHLRRLQTLDLVHNPIENFDRLSALSGGLKHLALGHANITKWPTTIHQLTHLNRLYIQDANISAIPSDAFSRRPLIASLTLKGTVLYDFPEPLCYLKHLHTLEYSSNQNHASEVDFFKPCAHGGLSSVTKLILDNDDFYQTPTDIFGTFPHLQILRIHGSKLLSSLDELTVPSSNQLQTLDLTENNLAAIPEVVMRMSKLTSLDVSGNPIMCSCFMRWMKTWPRRDNVTVTGTCVGGEQIRHYIDNSLHSFC